MAPHAIFEHVEAISHVIKRPFSSLRLDCHAQNITQFTLSQMSNLKEEVVERCLHAISLLWLRYLLLSNLNCSTHNLFDARLANMLSYFIVEQLFNVKTAEASHVGRERLLPKVHVQLVIVFLCSRSSKETAFLDEVARLQAQYLLQLLANLAQFK